MALAIALSGPTGPSHHEQRCGKPDQHAGEAQHDALPFIVGQRSGEIARQHASPPVAEVAQQIGDATDHLPLGAQHLAVELGNLAFGPRDRDDRIGVGIRGNAKGGIVDRKRPHALRGLLGGCRIVRQQGRGNLVLLPEQRSRSGPVGHFGGRLLEPLADRRQCREQFRAARNQRGDALDAARGNSRAAA